MTVPLVSLAGRYGYRPILWLNLAPRGVLLAWALLVGYFDAALPLRAILVSPASSVFGGECVFDSIAYSLVASLTDDHVVRYALAPAPSTPTNEQRPGPPTSPR